MNVYEIPTTPAAQRLTISLSGVLYQLVVKWNVSAQVWALDILDVDDNEILTGVPIVTGVDLLGQFGYLEFGGKLYALTDHDADLPPTFTSLGVTGHLYWVTE